MKTNLGVVDRTARTLLAVLMVISYLAGIINGTVSMGHFTASILTNISLIGLCVLYLPVRLSTLPLKVVEREPMHLG